MMSIRNNPCRLVPQLGIICAMRRISAQTLQVLLWLLATAFVTTGCLFTETDILYNNSGQDLTIVASYPSTNITSVVKNGTRIEFYSPFIEVSHGAVVWHYERKLPVDKRKLYKRVGQELFVKLQIQSDGAIYVIPPDSIGAVATFPPQPKGFPLVPIANSTEVPNQIR